MNLLFIKLGIGALISVISFLSFLKTKAKLGIWLLVIILPIFSIKFLAGDFYTIEFGDILLVAIILPFLLREIILSKKIGRTIPKEISNILLFFLIYFSFIFLTIFWTKDIFLTFRELIIVIVFGLLFFVSLLTISRWDTKDLQSTILLIILVGLVVAILGILQVFLPNFSIIQSVQPGFPTGIFTETNWYVHLLILVGCWSLFALKSQRKSLKILSTINLLVLLIGIYLAQSISGLAGFLYLLFIFFLHFLIKKPQYFISFIFIFLILVLTFQGFFAGFTKPLKEITSIFEGDISENMEIRSTQFLISLKLIKDNPFGYGAGTWEPLMEEATGMKIGPFGWINGILLEQGILAFMAWLVFIIGCLIIITNSLIRTKRWEAKAALFSFIWLLIAGLPHPIYYMNFFWFYMGFSVAVALVINRVFIKERMKLNSSN